MKKLIGLVLFVPFLVMGQKPTSTNAFEVRGEVKSEQKVRIEDLKKFKEHVIGEVIITNHMGEKKSEAKGLKGVLLREVLQSIEINSPSPKQLSEYYIVCKATDGYTIVYSWNEVFNNPSGDHIYIITEKEGKAAAEMTDAILMLSPKDLKTGRRYLKGLTTISILRAP